MPSEAISRPPVIPAGSTPLAAATVVPPPAPRAAPGSNTVPTDVPKLEESVESGGAPPALSPPVEPVPPGWFLSQAEPPVWAQPEAPHRRGVWIPASVIAMQGALLAMCAVAGLLAGWWLAQSQIAGEVPQPCVVTGTLQRIDDNGQSMADAGLVLLLPEGERLARSERLAVQDLLNLESSATEVSTRDKLRQVGGDVCRANADGFFYLKAPRPGRYHILCLATVARTRATPIDHQLLADVGKFVDQPHQLLGARAFHWQSLEVKTDQQLPIVIQP